jgi:hypothetical protein
MLPKSPPSTPPSDQRSDPRSPTPPPYPSSLLPEVAAAKPHVSAVAALHGDLEWRWQEVLHGVDDGRPKAATDRWLCLLLGGSTDQGHVPTASTPKKIV